MERIHRRWVTSKAVGTLVVVHGCKLVGREDDDGLSLGRDSVVDIIVWIFFLKKGAWFNISLDFVITLWLARKL
jgi:hypothetical protein